MIQLTDEQCEALGVPKGSTIGGTLVHSDAQMVALYPPKPKRWEPKGGDWLICADGTVVGYPCSDFDCSLDGAERETKEAAERAAKLITRYKRLLAYVDEHRQEGEEDDSVVFRAGSGWDFYFAECEDLGAVCMPERVAKQLIADLGSGVFVYE